MRFAYGIEPGDEFSYFVCTNEYIQNKVLKLKSDKPVTIFYGAHTGTHNSFSISTLLTRS